MLTADQHKSIRRSVRIAGSNIRAKARKRGLNPISLARTSNVRLLRVMRIWFGGEFTMLDLTAFMQALDMSVDDVFAGTKVVSGVKR